MATSSDTLTGAAGTGGGSGDALVANPLSQFAATTSAQLAGVISDEVGTGALPFSSAVLLQSLADAKGDLFAGTANDTIARLAVGTDGYRLEADSAQTAGIKWAIVAEGAGVYRSTNQSISNNTDTAISFDSESFDDNSYHSTVTNTSRITIPTTGHYLFTTTIIFAANATGRRQIVFRKNGTTSIGEISITGNSASDATTGCCTVRASLTAADYVEVVVNQTSGGALNVVGSTGCQCSVTKLR